MGDRNRDARSTVLLALVLVAAVPLLAFSATQVGLQTGTIDIAHDHGGAGEHEKVHQEHIDAGHFTLMAAFGFVVIGIGLLASLRPGGWWLPASITGLMVAFFGLASVVFPDAASSADTAWGVAAITWGVVFVGATVLTRDVETPSPYGERQDTATPEK